MGLAVIVRGAAVDIEPELLHLSGLHLTFLAFFRCVCSDLDSLEQGVGHD